MIVRLTSPFYAATAAIRLFWWKILGRRVLATELEELERLAECINCEEYEENTQQCKICTCWLRAKVKITSESCPKRLWLPIVDKRTTIT